MNELIAEIEIPEYPTKIKMSEKTRPVYYKLNKTRWNPRKLPKTYRAKLEKGIWSKDDDGYLRDEDGEKILANPQKAGKPNYEYLSGNRFTSGFGHYMVRKKIVDGLKEYYKQFIDIEPIEQFPLICEWDFYSKVKGAANFDMSNFWFYYKYFEDCLVDEGIIPDDNIQYVTKPGAPLFIPVDDWDDRKFVFRFYLDDRGILNEKETWSE